MQVFEAIEELACDVHHKRVVRLFSLGSAIAQGAGHEEHGFWRLPCRPVILARLFLLRIHFEDANSAANGRHLEVDAGLLHRALTPSCAEHELSTDQRFHKVDGLDRDGLVWGA